MIPGAWSVDPLVLVGLVGAGAAYAAGVRRLWGAGRRRRVGPGRVACFFAGLAVVAVALLSPVEALAERVLWGHMLQHVLLVLVAAPLIVVASPGLPVLYALPAGDRRRVVAWSARSRLASSFRLVARPVPAWLVATSVLWAWHVPSLYQAALESAWIHGLEHATLLGTALLFWWVALDPASRRRMAQGSEVLYVFTAGLAGSALGALLTFADVALYPAYGSSAAALGLTALQDQQLAGVIMWIPAGLVYLGAAAALFVSWLRAEEGRAARAFPAVTGERAR